MPLQHVGKRSSYYEQFSKMRYRDLDSLRSRSPRSEHEQRLLACSGKCTRRQGTCSKE